MHYGFSGVFEHSTTKSHGYPAPQNDTPRKINSVFGCSIGIESSKPLPFIIYPLAPGLIVFSDILHTEFTLVLSKNATGLVATVLFQNNGLSLAD